MRTGARTIGRGLLAGLAIWLCGVPATAAELVMFEAAGCPYCRAWDREIGDIYPLSDLAAVAPLRRVDVDAPRPADLAGVGPVVFTPTFVLVVDGGEAGRITGYIGEYQFWGLLEGMVRALPPPGDAVAERP